MTMKSKIHSLYRYETKGALPVKENALTFCEGTGIQGDYHGDGGDCQVALLTMTEKRWMENCQVKGFCFHKYKENILLDGGSLSDCLPGDLIYAGSVILRITESRKRCHPELCALSAAKERCILSGLYSFAAVEQSGVICVGMEMEKI